MPAERRSGMITPCAPNATAERMTAPRLRGSVTPSSATSSGGVPDSAACASRSGSRGVGERRHLQRDALVQDAAGAPVELGPADLEQRDAAVAGDAHRLGDPLVGLEPLRDVQRGRRDAARAAPRRRGCGRRAVRRPACRRDRPARGRDAALGGGPPRGGMALARLGRRRRALALQRALALAARADLRALLGLADRALAPRVAGHQLRPRASSAGRRGCPRRRRRPRPAGRGSASAAA